MQLGLQTAQLGICISLLICFIALPTNVGKTLFYSLICPCYQNKAWLVDSCAQIPTQIEFAWVLKWVHMSAQIAVGPWKGVSTSPSKAA